MSQPKNAGSVNAAIIRKTLFIDLSLAEQLLGGILAALKPDCWPDNRNWIPDNRGGIRSKSGGINWRAMAG
jgi:hypothetical protein